MGTCKSRAWPQLSFRSLVLSLALLSTLFLSLLISGKRSNRPQIYCFKKIRYSYKGDSGDIFIYPWQNREKKKHFSKIQSSQWEVGSQEWPSSFSVESNDLSPPAAVFWIRTPVSSLRSDPGLTLSSSSTVIFTSDVPIHSDLTSQRVSRCCWTLTLHNLGLERTCGPMPAF